MAIWDDAMLAADPGNVTLVRPTGSRRITHALHDIDGTHSLIRDWPPVMSVCLHWAMTGGLADDFDSTANAAALVERSGRDPLPETDKFCVESAGLSALTQMEFAIRRALELGTAAGDAAPALDDAGRRANTEIIRRIWDGQERFGDLPETPAVRRFIDERTPRLFRLYETVLNAACRDRNTAAARRDPAAWQVAGSMTFLQHLRAIGCRNYFITGAVIYRGGGMLEEVETLGFEVGPGKLIEELVGSSWDRKLPKEELMAELCRTQAIDPRQVLVVGDGRAEVKAGAEMGAVTLSRLPATAKRARELHVRLGTNCILPDFTHPVLLRALRAE